MDKEIVFNFKFNFNKNLLFPFVMTPSGKFEENFGVIGGKKTSKKNTLQESKQSKVIWITFDKNVVQEKSKPFAFWYSNLRATEFD